MKAVRKNRQRSSAFASIMALLLLAIFAAMGVAFFSTTSMSLAQSSNLQAGNEARLAAESGMGFMTYKMQNCGVSGSMRGQALLDALAAKLQTAMNSTTNLQGATVNYPSPHTKISIPSIALGDNKTFSAEVTLLPSGGLVSSSTLRLTVFGQYGPGAGAAVKRQVSMDFYPTWDAAIGFGLCSKGPVEMGMNTDLRGLYQASDGSIYSSAPGLAVSCGSGYISGDVSVSDPTATTAVDPSTVHGTIRRNAPAVDMPEFKQSDLVALRSLAVNVVDQNTNFSSGLFKNIRIRASSGTPSAPLNIGAVTIQGVMYIESPNYIKFTNNVNFTGVMIADKKATGSSDADNYIYFNNNMTFNSPQNLPETSEFTGIKDYTGISVLCQDFKMEFKNNMTSVGGIMALRALVAKNNVNSTLYGSLLIYGSEGLDFKNNSDLTISLTGSSPPKGFQGYGLPPLMPQPLTYVEK